MMAQMSPENLIQHLKEDLSVLKHLANTKLLQDISMRQQEIDSIQNIIQTDLIDSKDILKRSELANLLEGLLDVERSVLC